MKNIWIGLLILIVSCNSDKKTEEAIYNEYTTAFYNAYVQTKIETPEIIEPIWEIGDTISLDKNCILNNNKHWQKQITAPANLIVSEVTTKTIQLFLIPDSTTKGWINKERLKESIAYYSYQNQNKIDFYDSFLLNKQLFIDSVITKNGLTEKEFYMILAKENYRRTDNHSFLIH